MNDSEMKTLAETNNSDARDSAFTTMADLKRTPPAEWSISELPQLNSDQPFTSPDLQARESPPPLVNGIEKFRTKPLSVEVQRTHPESSQGLTTAQANAEEPLFLFDGAEDSRSKHSSLEVQVASLGDSEDSTDDHPSKELPLHDLSEIPLSLDRPRQRKKPPPNIKILPYEYRPYDTPETPLKLRIRRRLERIKTGFVAIVLKICRKKRA